MLSYKQLERVKSKMTILLGLELTNSVKAARRYCHPIVKY